MLFLGNEVHGDFGTSIRTGEPATAIVMDRVGASFRLVTMALMVTLLISVPLGVFAAVHRGQWVDKAAMALALAHAQR